ncbi:unnamed protein product [Sympodiomycopsis kandeliae]
MDDRRIPIRQADQNRTPDEFSALTQDLLPSPPSMPAAQGPVSTISRSDGKRKKQITTADLKHKQCWICTDGDDDQDAASVNGQTRSENGAKALVDQRKFVHACQCTLLAHEACLFRWIESKAAHHNSPPVACPQCKVPYKIVSPKPLALKIFEQCEDTVSGILPYLGYSTIVGLVLGSLTAYGAAAYTAWVGKAAAGRVLNRKWPWHYWFQLPTIPMAMIIARLPGGNECMNAVSFWYGVSALQGFAASLTTMNEPGILTFASMHGVPDATLYSKGPLGDVLRQYPPGPAATALLAPWIRMMYALARRRTTRWVLRPLIKRKNAGQVDGQGASPTAGPPRRHLNMGRIQHRRLRFVIGENVGVDTDGEYDDHIPPGVQSIVREEVDEADADQPVLGDIGRRPRTGQTVYITLGSLARLSLETLSLPFISSIIGQGLSFVADKMKPGNWLQRLLGIPQPPRGQSQRWSSWASASHPQSFHWRNTISLWLYVVGRDSLSLVYRYLRLKQRSKARIADLPFDDNIALSFELK